MRARRLMQPPCGLPAACPQALPCSAPTLSCSQSTVIDGWLAAVPCCAVLSVVRCLAPHGARWRQAPLPSRDDPPSPCRLLHQPCPLPGSCHRQRHLAGILLDLHVGCPCNANRTCHQHAWGMLFSMAACRARVLALLARANLPLPCVLPCLHAAWAPSPAPCLRFPFTSSSAATGLVLLLYCRCSGGLPGHQAVSARDGRSLQPGCMSPEPRAAMHPRLPPCRALLASLQDTVRETPHDPAVGMTPSPQPSTSKELTPQVGGLCFPFHQDARWQTVELPTDLHIRLVSGCRPSPVPTARPPHVSPLACPATGRLPASLRCEPRR